MPQEYVFIALDIFHVKLDNGGVSKNNQLEAWLTFLSVDKPGQLLALLDEQREHLDAQREQLDK